MKPMVKKVFSFILRIAISLVLLYILFRQVDEKSLLGILRTSHKPLLLLAFFIFSLNYVLCLFRWEMLLKAAKIHLELKRVIISFAGGVFFSLFLPSTIGGDLVRSVDLAVHTKRAREVVATVFLDRISGYVGLVLVALTAMLLGRHLVLGLRVQITMAVITVILLAVLAVLFNKFVYSKINNFLHPKEHTSQAMIFGKASLSGIRQILTDLHQEIHVLGRHRLILAKNVGVSIVIQLLSPFTFYLIGTAVGMKVPIGYFFIFLPIIGAITLLPISLGGLGLRDILTVSFFALAGVSKNIAFSASLINFFFLVVYGMIGGAIYVLTVHHRRLQHHSSPRV